MLQWIENLTYKTPPGRNIASTSRISLPNLDASIFENASTFTTGSMCIYIIYKNNMDYVIALENLFLHVHLGNISPHLV